ILTCRVDCKFLSEMSASLAIMFERKTFKEIFFSGYGKLLEIDLKNGSKDMRGADDAVYELNGKELCGERVITEHARGPRGDGYGYGGRSGGYSSWNRSGRDKYGPRVRTEHRLIVENLSSRFSSGVLS
uniref:RRM domain-containing protein n=1 Tax=Lates calcarifer TaxID=8187 RepID=A0A4W6D4C2_LATCA